MLNVKKKVMKTKFLFPRIMRSKNNYNVLFFYTNLEFHNVNVLIIKVFNTSDHKIIIKQSET